MNVCVCLCACSYVCAAIVAVMWWFATSDKGNKDVADGGDITSNDSGGTVVVVGKK